jgi:purine-binding chemotaxis protein CheW
MQALVLPLHADRYALELTAVREVVPQPEVTPLPGAPAPLVGVFNLRGEVVPVFDTAALLGLASAAPCDQVTVADTPFGPAGLVSHGRPWRDALGAAAGPGTLAAAVGRYAVAGEPGAVATLLDVERLFAPALAAR